MTLCIRAMNLLASGSSESHQHLKGRAHVWFNTLGSWVLRKDTGIQPGGDLGNGHHTNGSASSHGSCIPTLSLCFSPHLSAKPAAPSPAAAPHPAPPQSPPRFPPWLSWWCSVPGELGTRAERALEGRDRAETETQPGGSAQGSRPLPTPNADGRVTARCCPPSGRALQTLSFCYHHTHSSQCPSEVMFLLLLASWAQTAHGAWLLKQV